MKQKENDRTRHDRQTSNERPPLTPLRLFFAIVGVSIMMLAGGCGLSLGPLGSIMILPAGLGLVIWVLAVTLGR
jgi:Flp pilus assembly protein TadB